MKEERHVIWSNYGLDYEDSLVVEGGKVNAQ